MEETPLIPQFPLNVKTCFCFNLPGSPTLGQCFESLFIALDQKGLKNPSKQVKNAKLHNLKRVAARPWSLARPGRAALKTHMRRGKPRHGRGRGHGLAVEYTVSQIIDLSHHQPGHGRATGMGWPCFFNSCPILVFWPPKWSKRPSK